VVVVKNSSSVFDRSSAAETVIEDVLIATVGSLAIDGEYTREAVTKKA
jgi:hypothetical protein